MPIWSIGREKTIRSGLKILPSVLQNIIIKDVKGLEEDLLLIKDNKKFEKEIKTLSRDEIFNLDAKLFDLELDNPDGTTNISLLENLHEKELILIKNRHKIDLEVFDNLPDFERL